MAGTFRQRCGLFPVKNRNLSCIRRQGRRRGEILPYERPYSLSNFSLRVVPRRLHSHQWQLLRFKHPFYESISLHRLCMLVGPVAQLDAQQRLHRHGMTDHEVHMLLCDQVPCVSVLAETGGDKGGIRAGGGEELGVFPRRGVPYGRPATPGTHPQTFPPFLSGGHRARRSLWCASSRRHLRRPKTNRNILRSFSQDCSARPGRA